MLKSIEWVVPTMAKSEHNFEVSRSTPYDRIDSAWWH